MMALQISLPEELAGELTRRATQQRRTAQEIVIDLLNGLLGIEKDDEFETPEQVVARIKALPRDTAITPAPKEMVAAAQARSTTDENFDLAQWTEEWRIAEAEIREMTRQDDIREGRLWTK
jgi:hypothetical protein